MPIPRFTTEDTVLLVIDMQDRLLPAIHDHEATTAQVVKLIDGCNALDIPVLVTEQYRKGLGETVPQVSDHFPDDVIIEEKLKFSVYTKAVREHLATLGRKRVIICGIETHVCVLQSALDLAQAGYITGVTTDAVSSRRPTDRDTALTRMEQAGVIPLTVEMVLLELVFEAGTDEFKSILPIIK